MKSLDTVEICKQLFDDITILANLTSEELKQLSDASQSNVCLPGNLQAALQELARFQLTIRSKDAISSQFLYELYLQEQLYIKDFVCAYMEGVVDDKALVDIKSQVYDAAQVVRETHSRVRVDIQSQAYDIAPVLRGEHITLYGPFILLKCVGLLDDCNYSYSFLYPNCIREDCFGHYPDDITKDLLNLVTDKQRKMDFIVDSSSESSGTCNTVDATDQQLKKAISFIRKKGQVLAEQNGEKYYMLEQPNELPMLVKLDENYRIIKNVYSPDNWCSMHLPKDILLQQAHFNGKKAKFTFISIAQQTIYIINAKLSDRSWVISGHRMAVDCISTKNIGSKYTINGENITCEAEINSKLWPERSISDIEDLMKTPNHVYSSTRFLKTTDSLLAVVKEDFLTAKLLGITNLQIAELLNYFKRVYKEKKDHVMFLGKKFCVYNAFALDDSALEEGASAPWVFPASNGLLSPFDDQDIGGFDIVLENEETGKKFGFSTTLIHLIATHGFYERGPYWLDLKKLINFLVEPWVIPALRSQLSATPAAFLEKLLKGTDISSLDLSDNSLDKLGAEGLVKFLSALKDTQVRWLNLNDNRLYKLGAEGLIKVLSALKDTQVSSLDLGLNNLHRLGTEGIIKVLSALKGTQVSSLGLGYHNLHFGTEELIKVLSVLKDTQVSSLDLSLNNLHRLGTEELIKVLSVLKDTQVSSLDLSHNQLDKLGTEGLVKFSSALKDTQVSSLNLSHNSLYKPGIDSLDKLGIEEIFEVLNSLNLNNNSLYKPGTSLYDLGIEGLVKVLSALKDTQVSSLNLNNNSLYKLGDDSLYELGTEGLVKFLSALKDTQVSSLNLSHNSLDKLGTEGLVKVLSALKDTQVSSLNLSGIAISKERSKELFINLFKILPLNVKEVCVGDNKTFHFPNFYLDNLYKCLEYQTQLAKYLIQSVEQHMQKFEYDEDINFETMSLAFEINENIIPILVKELGNQKTGLASLICGLLLTTQVPIVTEIKDDQGGLSNEILEKNSNDGITYLLSKEVNSDPRLKRIANSLLSRIRTVDNNEGVDDCYNSSFFYVPNSSPDSVAASDGMNAPPPAPV